MRFSLLLICTLLFSIPSLIAQNRIDRPLQIHLNGSGLFLKAFGSSLADSEIDELQIKKWGIPGFSVGYHLNKRIYVGYAFQPNRNLLLKEPWTFGNGESDGNILLNHNTGNFHSLEGRYFPFKFDLYASVFFTHVSKAQYNLDFDRIGSTMVLGENAYITDIEADWNFKSLQTIGFGIGYNYVSKSGFSFDLGLGLPIPLQEPLHENIQIVSTQGTAIDPFDIEEGKRKIENELFYFPVQLHVNIGYNLHFKEQ